MKKLNNRISSNKRIKTMPEMEQFKLFEKMLEAKGLRVLSSFQIILQIGPFVPKKTLKNNSWVKINSAICDLEETMIKRLILEEKEGMFEITEITK